MTPAAPPDLAAFRLPSTEALADQAVTVDLEDGQLTLSFAVAGQVRWEATGVTWAGSGTSGYDAVEIDPDAYFVDLDLPDRPLHALTVVFSRRAGWALAVYQSRNPALVGGSPRVPAVEHAFSAGRVAGAGDAEPPRPTRDLVGRWHRYRYSPDNYYEHIYVSGERFVSHNLDTQNTRDRADCHPVSYYRLAAGLYLVAWREFDSQMAAIAVEHLGQAQVTAKALHPADRFHSVNVRIGGFIRPVVVRFPADNAGGPPCPH